jgi:hypothetical protein
MLLRSIVLGCRLVPLLWVAACAPAADSARKPGNEATPPEACLALTTCCEELEAGGEDDEGAACRAEVTAGTASDTGGVRCSRARDDLRDRGFCGGNPDDGTGTAALGQGPGCRALEACCASLEVAEQRSDCAAERATLLAVAGARRNPDEVDDSCADAFDAKIAAGTCDASVGAGLGQAGEGPACRALADCCATLGLDARKACETSVAQIVNLPDDERRCDASHAAYLAAGLCTADPDPGPDPEPPTTCALVAPELDACCACPAGKSCAKNGCYNGYLCDPVGCACAKAPTSGPCSLP